MAIGTSTVEAFSIASAAVLSPSGAQAQKLTGVRGGTLTLEYTAVDNKQDDWTVGTWFQVKAVTIAVDAGYISWSAIAYLTGSPVISSAGAPDDYWATPLWHQYGKNNPPIPLALRCAAKDSAGNVKTLDLVLYQCYLGFEFTSGPAYKTGMTCSYQGKAVPSAYDDSGNPLADKAFGRITAWASDKTGSALNAIGPVRVRSSDSATGTEPQAQGYKTLVATLPKTMAGTADTAKAATQTERLALVLITSADTGHGTEGTPKAGITDPAPETSAISEAAARGYVFPAKAPLSGAGILAGSITGALGHTTISGLGVLASPSATTRGKPAAMSGTGTLSAIVKAQGAAALSGNGYPSALGTAGNAPATTISPDPSTPQPTQRAWPVNGSAVSGSFSPPAGSLVVVMVAWLFGSTTKVGSLAVTDSKGSAYNGWKTVLNPGGVYNLSVGIFGKYYAAAPGSITVTVANSDTTSATVYIAPRVYTGTYPDSSGAKGGTASATGSGAVPLVTTTVGSAAVAVTANYFNSTGGVIDANTTKITFWSDSQSGDDAASGYMTSPTSVPGTVTLGFANMSIGVAAEILP